LPSNNHNIDIKLQTKIKGLKTYLNYSKKIRLGQLEKTLPEKEKSVELFNAF